MITIGENVEALLFDLDGVLVDSAAVERPLVEELFATSIDQQLWDRAFPQPLEPFLLTIAAGLGRQLSAEELEEYVYLLQVRRRSGPLPMIPGINKVIDQGRQRGLKLAVVSNNPVAEVEEIITQLELEDFAVFGLQPGINSKPAPDLYQLAAAKLEVNNKKCLALEDSALGVQAAQAAGMKVYSIGPGEQLGAARHYYFLQPEQVEIVKLRPGQETTIITGSPFLSHMIEHILWRANLAGKIIYPGNDFRRLGEKIILAIEEQRQIINNEKTWALLDGSVASSSWRSGSGLRLSGGKKLGLAGPVEDLDSGEALQELLAGLAANRQLRIKLYSADDPHHAWEAIFRSLGSTFDLPGGRPLVFEQQGQRKTAESSCQVQLSAAEEGGHIEISGAPRPDIYRAWEKLLSPLGQFLDLSAQMEISGMFSTHMIAEDLGWAIGQVFRQSAEQAMTNVGIRGYGADQGPAGLVVVSFEGRVGYFQQPAPEPADWAEYYQQILPLADLDDFMLGFSQGMGLTVAVFFADRPGENSWPEIYTYWAQALATALAPLPERRGVIAGTKGTLQ